MNDRKHGYGVYVYSSSSKYEGTWIDGSKNGWGIHTYPSGTRYEGEWIHDKQVKLLQLDFKKEVCLITDVNEGGQRSCYICEWGSLRWRMDRG